MSEGEPGPGRRLQTTVVMETDDPPLTAGAARGLLRSLARRLRLSAGTVAAVFCDDGFIRGLNRKFRGKDRATDVLAFPSGAHAHLGDIVISSDAACRQARRRGHSPAREARVLMIHGFLHLLGYDHETDDGEMRTLERTLRSELAAPGGDTR